jgi:O-antigen/teichoic acid export membrane protein
VLIATALTSLLIGTGLCLRELARYAVLPDWQSLTSLFRFAMPFLPGGLCFFLLQHGDKVLLLLSHGKKEVGIYAVGYKLALAAGTFTLAPLQMVWGAKMYAAARASDAPIVFGQVFTRCLACVLFASLALCLFATEAVALLGGQDYAGARFVVLPVLLACVCQAAATLMDAAFYIRNRPGLKLGVTLVTTVVMTTAYFLLIPKWGSMGAALATLIGFVFLMGATWLVTRRLFPVRYEIGRLGALAGLSGVIVLAAAPLPATAWALPIKGGLLLAWPCVLWCCGLVTAEEKDHVRSLLAMIGKRLQWTSGRPQVIGWFRSNALLAEQRGVTPPVSGS